MRYEEARGCGDVGTGMRWGMTRRRCGERCRGCGCNGRGIAEEQRLGKPTLTTEAISVWLVLIAAGSRGWGSGQRQ